MLKNLSIGMRLGMAFALAYLFMIVIALVALSGWSMAVEVTIGLLVVGVVLGSMIGVVFVRSITEPLRMAVEVSNQIAAGNLTGKIDYVAGDAIGELFNALREMSRSLNQLVGEVQSASSGIANATSEIAAGNLDLSNRTESQAAALQHTTGTMNDITSTVRQNAENAKLASELANTASEVAVRGGEVVTEVVNTMGAINDSARKISDIIGVIDGIAFQTNILALNAAVEAARAGEQGRGFAVVAAEVRSLAQRSAGAANEIKQLINDSVSKVEMGNVQVAQAGNTMNEVVSSINRVTEVVSQISHASHEQRGGIEEMNRTIIQMDEVTQQNAALVEESAAAARSLQDQTEHLDQQIRRFTLAESHVLRNVTPEPRALAGGSGRRTNNPRLGKHG